MNQPWLKLAGRRLLPIVQGGMGIGISAHRLAGAVARENGVGTIASIDLRHHHPDLMERTRGSRDKPAIEAANLEALDREIRAARTASEGRGLIAVNVMKAVGSHAALVRQSCESGADAIVMGAGLPLDLPELTASHPRVALIPILSEARGIGLVLRRWMKKGRLPDAIVVEHPAHAGGHLGAASIQDLSEPRFSFSRVLAECRELFAQLGLAWDSIPLILAGGIDSHAKVRHWLGEGAAAVQLGTAFAVTEECDAHPAFKQVLATARPETLREFTSVAGLPARAVLTPWLSRYLSSESRLQRRARPRECLEGFDCLQACGLRDGIARIGQFCIDLKLAQAVRGDVERGLFFRGRGALPFGEAIRPVAELMHYLLTGEKPAGLAPA
ncbi:NAD(P)H-dependent flavin oxidoreductase YrpB, nitropropane dioxygenase family [Cupriavidus necator]|uniref:2-Nitropropane dioxygenase n=1 Tax=Cupriavidus necator (strain ATCC 17699 / DSM 428 / KCTC 22496 / NCIMB 10442 / H16 / Stanier 337) TaxID=381666 RepID=Q0JYR1_CUPNH|nr:MULTISPECIES: nitronate monooxygenase family protein [Cupriavidus]EON19959.1 2-nitropropane dioxygenase [Cupriavidus sp. GA3-3]QCC04885.1 nitronate monooxygenase [Cupriavidus necator H16]QQB79573.1 nitronate monooxygenase [Cupriavidus necator]WKA43816.1 nitronate monooxygenase family protein [Cupriavidus necator]CAJ97113.1 2-Nitropropane dioxygenase [Cupriavidus necator H16]